MKVAKMKPINSLLPKNETSALINENKGHYFSTYKCRTCGAEQLVIINTEDDTPIMNPKCYNRFCNDYGYRGTSAHKEYEFNSVHSGKILVKDFAYECSLILVSLLNEDRILCVTTMDPQFLIADIDIMQLEH